MEKLYFEEVFQSFALLYVKISSIYSSKLQINNFLIYSNKIKGVSWEHIPSDQALVSISIGPNGQVWAVGKNGSSYWRFGVTNTKLTGTVLN